MSQCATPPLLRAQAKNGWAARVSGRRRVRQVAAALRSTRQDGSCTPEQPPLRYSAHAHARARRWWPSAIGTDDAAGADPPAASPADASTRRPNKQPWQHGHRLSGAQHKRWFPGGLPLAMATATALALASRCPGHLKLCTPPPFVVPLPIYLDISWLG
jgi:hypothetical protein